VYRCSRCLREWCIDAAEALESGVYTQQMPRHVYTPLSIPQTRDTADALFMCKRWQSYTLARPLLPINVSALLQHLHAHESVFSHVRISQVCMRNVRYTLLKHLHTHEFVFPHVRTSRTWMRLFTCTNESHMTARCAFLKNLHTHERVFEFSHVRMSHAYMRYLPFVSICMHVDA